MFTVDHSSPYIIEVADILSSEECDDLVKRIDELEPEVAPINTQGGTKVHTDIRNNERVMFEDVDLAAMVCERCRDKVPKVMRKRVLVGANELFRCYRYKPGMRFAPHADGSFERDETEKSFYTFLIYLNGDFEGGETNFFTRPEVSIKPVKGLGVLFQHPIVHEGALVQAGVKYVARTDLMYRKQT